MAQYLTEEIRALIGVETVALTIDVPVERGAVRRFAQAVMDNDPSYMDPEYVSKTRYRQLVAPPMFPVTMMHTTFGQSDPMSERAHDPNFDGLVETSVMGLPQLPLINSTQLNAGAEFEMFRLAQHGEFIRMQSRYRDIYERQITRGAVLFVIIETDFTDLEGQLICRFRKTLIRG